MEINRARVHRSESTWQQPTPPPGSAMRSAVIERVAELILALGTHRLRVGVDGPTAAGKTSFGHELGECIARAGRPVLRASLDDFKKPWEDRLLYDRETGEGYYRNAFDYGAVIRLLLEPAGPAGSGDCVLCHIDPLTQVDHSTVITRAAPDAVLVVDGVFAFRPEINKHWDFRVWLDIDPERSMRRGTERDQDWAGSNAEGVHHRYQVAEDVYRAEVNPLSVADIVIDNRAFEHPKVINKPAR